MRHADYQDLTVSVQELDIGMRVVALDRPWEETTFLLQGFVIASNHDIRELQRQCQTVTVQVRIESVPKGAARTPSNPGEVTAAPKPTKTGPASTQRVNYINQVSFERAVDASRLTFDSARSLATSIMEGLRVGRNLDVSECRDTVDKVVDSILANKDALRFLSMIKHKDSYTAEHSMNVCILSATFARHLGLLEYEIRDAALCGLLHDVGKSRIPVEILNKPGRFTREEAYIMAEHPTHGRNILMSASAEFKHAIDVAHTHHERMDGKGYPRGLRHQQISYYAKIVALADAYDAMTSERCYGTAKTSEQALKMILRDRGSHFDSELSKKFVTCIGFYPSGCLIELAGGQVAIVLEPSQTDFARPRLRVLTDDQQHRLETPYELNLADPTNQSVFIRAEVHNGTAGIDINTALTQEISLL
ncbi:HD-GYP domain-containing protein [Saccharospirillum impatiens]|uniref:HD-GYP domain-containing protein n=1 Tax=Saccharospirillum impatiens TaxID=169438 RepID=UPI000402C4AC|nr:HD-GYP domain-containing protein [Saccharospirillum impatiens]